MADRWVLFVRAIMQGREGLTGDVLRRVAVEAGGTDPRTHGSTGNVAVDAEDGRAVAAAVGALLTAQTGRATPVLPRTIDRLARLAELVPGGFGDPPEDVEHVVVFARTAVPADLPIEWPARLRLLGRDGPDAWFTRTRGRGSHPHPIVEAAGVGPATARSWRTLDLILRRERT